MIQYSEGIEFKTLFPYYIDKILEHQEIHCIYDVGCNVGAFVQLINNKLKNSYTIYGFEPDSENYKFLLSQNYKNLTAYNIGIFYGVEESRVTGIGDNNTGGYMVEGIEKTHLMPHINSIEVYQGKIFKLSTLERFINENLPLDLIKLDVEASEYNIIKNSKILKEFSWIIVEFHNHDINFYRSFIEDNLPQYDIITNENPFLLKKKTI